MVLDRSDRVMRIIVSGKASGPSCDIDFEIAERDIAASERGPVCIPVRVAGFVEILALGLSLTFDAVTGVGKRTEASHGNSASTVFALAVFAILHSLQCVFDPDEFAALDLDQLAADLALNGVQGGVDQVAGRLAAKLLEHTQVTGQRFAQRLPSP